MWLVYLIAVVLGGGSLLVQMFAGGDGHGDGFFDHADPGHPDGPGILSTRSAIYALFTFGLVGGLLHVPGLVQPTTALVIAVLSAIATTVAIGTLFRSLDDVGASGAARLDEVIGRPARVLVGCARGQRGKVRLQLKGHVVDVMATTDEERIAEGAEVVIIAVRDDVVHVASKSVSEGMA